jgi:hypothetical protein
VNLIQGSDVISASIDSGVYRFEAGGDMIIQVSFTNLKDQDVYLLKWDTPFTEHGNYLSITSKNTTARIPYHGIIAKRGDPDLESYISLKPRESRSMKVNIRKNYPIYKAGVYTMKLLFSFKDYSFLPSEIPKKRNHFTRSSPVESNTVEIEIIGSNIPAVKNETRLSNSKKRLTGRDFMTSSCSDTKINTLQTAWNTYEGMIANSVYQINLGNTQNYRTWFGTHTTTRYTRVKNVIVALRNVINYYDACIFDCSYSGCDSDVYAFVYPTDTSRRIHLCSYFWSSPAGGGYSFDTQAGTILHELSHFDAIGNPGNDDIAYGETALRNLAYSNPSGAIYNADSYEYFSENVFN